MLPHTISDPALAAARQQKSNKIMAGAGIRYISEDLIRKVSRQDHLESITVLNLTLAREGGKKIKFIENLEKLKRLQTLNLSCNIIEKMDRFDQLTRLRELNLSFNHISRIDNIEMLTGLQVLNLTGNRIEHIPMWIGRKLKCLQIFRIAKNNLQSLHELSKLKPLRDLTQLSVADNPVSKLPHARLYLVFHLKTLDSLDAKAISLAERETANHRFSQDEISRLETQLGQLEQEYTELHDQHNLSLQNLERHEHSYRDQNERAKEDTEKIQTLEMELNTKNDLLKMKTEQLTKACEKHYELEQELAFYKIDHKFDTLGKFPTHTYEDSGAFDGLVGESPYIGKGRFKQHQRPSLQPPTQQEGLTQMDIDRDMMEKMHDALDRELAEKQAAIDKAQDRLHHLKTELAETDAEMKRAAAELERLASQAPAKLSEDDKQFVRAKLTKKINKVHFLHGEAKKIESAMATTQTEISEQEKDIGRLQGKLQRIGSMDSLYNIMTREMADKEEQLSITNQQYSALQNKLEEMLLTIAKETEDIRKLEQELREGQAAQNDEIKNELEGIIGGLQTYLTDVRHKADHEKSERDNMVREREQMLSQLQELEHQEERAKNNNEQILDLQHQLAMLNASVLEHQDLNASLQHQLEETRGRELEEADIAARLHGAEDEIAQLKGTLVELSRKAQNDKDHYQKHIENEREKSQHLMKRALDADQADKSLRTLHGQLNDVQTVNAGLEEELYSVKKLAHEDQQRLVNPDDLRRRLNDVVKCVRTGKGGIVLRGGDDVIGETLTELQEQVNQELDKSFKDTKRAQLLQEQAENDLIYIQEEMDRVKDKERKRAERAIQERMELEDEEIAQLRQDIAHMKYELQKAWDAAEAARNQADSSSTTSTETESMSTVPSSQWMQKKQIMYDGMTPNEQDLFDELEDEIEQLRQLLYRKDKQASKKAVSVGDKATSLREMIEKRTSGTSMISTNHSEVLPPRKSTDGRRKVSMSVRDRGQSARSSEGTRSTSSDNERRAPRSKRQSDPMIEQAAKDLARAYEKIDILKRKLDSKETKASRSGGLSQASEDVVGEQQEEIEDLHRVLDDQRLEIENLNKQLDRLHNDEYAAYPDELNDIRRDTTRIHDSLSNHDRFLEQDAPESDLLMYSRGESQRLNSHRGESHRRDSNRGESQRMYSRRGDSSPTRQTAAAPSVDYYRQVPLQGPAYDEPSPGGPPLTHRNPHHQRADPGYVRHAHDNQPGRYDNRGHEGGAGDGYYRSLDPPHTGSRTQGDAAAREYHDPGYVPRSSGFAEEYPVPMPGSAAIFPGTQMFDPYDAQMPGYQGNATHIQAPQMHPGTITGNPGAIHSINPQGTMMAPGYPGQPVQVANTVPGYVDPSAQVSTVAPGYPGSHTPGHVVQTQVPGSTMAPGNGVVYAPVVPNAQGGGQVVQGLPTTPGGAVVYPAGDPMTPIAGSGMNTLNTTAPLNQSMMQPVMVSTPAKPGVRGILKNGVLSQSADDSTLLCCILEHHDMEDYIAKLQKKIATLKGGATHLLDDSLSDNSSSSLEDKRVLFLDDQQRKDHHVVRRLQKELQTRRAELDALDLAVVKQRSSLKQMKAAEKSLLNEKQHAELELSQMQEENDDSCLPKGQRRREFLEGKVHYFPRDVDSWDLPNRKLNYKSYLTDELDCVEETLMKRRAELREADRLLMECQEDLKDARLEGLSLVQSYDATKQRYNHLLSDAAELERRADDAGVLIVKAEEQVQEVRSEVEELTALKHDQEILLSEIELVIKKKDEEFQMLDGKVKQATKALEALRDDLAFVDLEHQERALKTDESEKIVLEHRRELDILRTQVDTERTTLDNLLHTTYKEKSELESVEMLLEKRHGQLETINTDMESEMKMRRLQIKELDKSLDDMRKEKTILESDVDKKQQQLHQEERELQKTQNSMSSLQYEMSQLSSVRESMSEAQSQLQLLTEKQTNTEQTIDKLQREKMQLEETQKSLERKVTQMRRLHTQTEDNLKSSQLQLAQIEGELRESKTDISNVKLEKSHEAKSLTQLKDDICDAQNQLSEIRDDISDVHGQRDQVRQKETEKRKTAEERYATLDNKVKILEKQVTSMESDNTETKSELEDSKCDIKRLKDTYKQAEESNAAIVKNLENQIQTTRQELGTKKQEIMSMKSKFHQEVSDLETIAQTHCSRANRLSDELNYLGAEHLEMKRQVQSQEQLSERESRLEKALRELKTDVTLEVNGSEGSNSVLLQDLQHMQAQKQDLEKQLSTLKHTLQLIRSGKDVGLDIGLYGKISGNEHFSEQQDILKRTLENSVTRHAESFHNQRIISYSNLTHLQHKLDNLEQVLNNGDGDRMNQVNSLLQNGSPARPMSPYRPISPHGSIRPGSPHIHSTDSNLSPHSNRAYSPHRHSLNRRLSGEHLPERDPTT